MPRSFCCSPPTAMSAAEALLAATRNAADLIGAADRIGTLQPEHFADIVAVTGDPLGRPLTIRACGFCHEGGRGISRAWVSDRLPRGARALMRRRALRNRGVAEPQIRSGQGGPPMTRCKAIATALGLMAVIQLAHAGTVYVHAGRVIDPEQGKELTDQRLTITDGRISAMAPWSAPAGDGTVIDWSHYTVLPGLIDMHTHISQGYADNNDPTDPLKHSVAETAYKAAESARIMLEAGFTSVRDVGVYRGLTDVALRDAIELGEVEGPRMLVAGAYITVPGGGGAVTGFSPDVIIPADFQLGEVRNPSEARDRARYLLQHGADFIKLIATGAVLALGSEPGQLELSEAEMKAACDEAALHGSYCIAHAHGTAGIKAAIRAGVRSVEHASLIDDEGIAMAKARGIWLDMDIYDGDWIDQQGTRKAGLPSICARIVIPPICSVRAFEGGQGWREAELWHRCRRLSLWVGCPAVRLHGALWHDSDAGNPIGDHGGS